MAQAKKGDNVKINYKGTLEDGSVFDSSEGREPLQVTLGSGQVIPGFEEAILGMSQGESKTVTIPSDKAYGQYNNDLVMPVPIDQVPPDMNPEVGQKLELGAQDGQVMIVTVIEIAEDQIVLDANPPLAGKDLTFEIELVQIA